MFQVFDATWGGNSFGSPSLWVGGKFMVDRDRTIDTANEDDARAIVGAILYDDPIFVQKSDGWQGLLFGHGEKTIACLDFEGCYSRQPIINYLENFRRQGPNLRVGYYPFFPLHRKTQFDGNHDVFLRMGKEMKSWLASAKEYTRPIVKLMDYLAPDLYLLGPGVFDRDLQYMVAISKAFASYDRPIYPFVWGKWHDAFNPPGTPGPTADQYDQYVASLVCYFDGCFVWGPIADNMGLISALSRANLLPTDEAKS